MKETLIENSMNCISLAIQGKTTHNIIFISNGKKIFQETLEFGKLVFTSMGMTPSQYLKVFLMSLIVIYNCKICNEICKYLENIQLSVPVFQMTNV